MKGATYCLGQFSALDISLLCYYNSLTMGLTRSSAGTLYNQILAALVGAIRAGEIGVGDKLPTEADLVDTYGVSRTTARRALDELHRQGLVRREPGRGTFLADPKIHADLPYLHSFSEEIRRLGYEPGARLLTREEVVADPKIAERLGVGAGSPAMYVRRLRTADGHPIFVCDSHLPLERFPALRQADYSVNSLYKLFEEVVGKRISRAAQWISAGAADAEVAELLELEAGSPILKLERVTYVAREEPVESVGAHFHPERYRHYSELVPQPVMVADLTGREGKG